MAQLQPERQLVEDSPHAFNDDQFQGQWSTRTEPPTPTPTPTATTAVVIAAAAAVIVDDQPHTSRDDQHHEKKSVLKKVKDKAKKLKASLTKSKKHGRDHENDVQGRDTGYAEDGEEDDDSGSDYDEESSPSLQGRAGGSVTGVTHSMSGLNAFGTRDPFPKKADVLVKDPAAPKPGINLASPESISSTGFYDPQDLRAAPGMTPTLQPIQAISTVNPGAPVDFRSTEIMPAAARPVKELQHVDHISTDAIPRSKNNAHGQLEFMKTTMRDPTEVAAGAPTTTKVMVPEGIMKPVMEKSTMESPLKPVNEGQLQADLSAPPIIRKAEAALASLDKSTSGLGHEEHMDGKGRSASAKVEERIVDANVVPSQGGERHSAKSWGEWTPGELLQGSIAPQQERQGFGARKTSNSGEHVNAIGNEKLWEEARDGEGKGYTQKIYDTAGIAKAKATGNDKLWEDARDGEGNGYKQKIYATAGTAKDKDTGNEKLWEEARDGEGKGYTQKIYDMAGTAKDKATGNEKLWEEARGGEGRGYTQKIYAKDKATGNEKLWEEVPDGEGRGYTQKSYATAGTAKDKATGNEKLWEEARDGEGKGYAQKIYDMAGTAKDVISSKLGYGGHEPAVVDDKHKSLTEENDLGAPERYSTGKSYAADNLSSIGNEKLWEEARDGEGKGHTQKIYDTARIPKDKATGNEKLWEEARDGEGKGNKQKIYATAGTAKDKDTGNEKLWEETRDGEGKGYAQKIYDMAGTAKDVISSKLGYGGHERAVLEGKHKSLTEENDLGAPERYSTGKSYAADNLYPIGNEKLWEEARDEGKGYTRKIYDTAGIAKDKATGNEKLSEEARDREGKGFKQKIYATAGTAKDKATGNEKLWEEARDGEGKTYTQKIYDTAGTAKDVISSKLGYGGHESAVLEEKHKSLTEENDLGAPESYNTGKSYAADNLSPLYGTASTDKNVTASEPGYGGQSDVQRQKPKSIVEEKHITAIYHVVGGGEGNQTMRSSMVNADAVSHGTAFGKDSVAGDYADASEGSPGGKGIVGRVTEAVSSLLGVKSGEELSDATQADIQVRKSEQYSAFELRRKEEWRLKFQA